MMLRAWPTWRTDAIGLGAMVALTVAFLAGPVWLVVDQRGRADEARAELVQEQAQVGRAERALSAARSNLAEVNEQLAQWPVQLRPTSAVNTKLARLSALAGECGVLIDEVEPGEGTPAEHYQSVPVQLTGQSSYRQCAVFFRQLRRDMPDMGVRGFEITGNAADPGAPGVLAVELVWYADLSDRAATPKDLAARTLQP